MLYRCKKCGADGFKLKTEAMHHATTCHGKRVTEDVDAASAILLGMAIQSAMDTASGTDAYSGSDGAFDGGGASGDY